MQTFQEAMKKEMEQLGDKWPGYSWARYGFPGWWNGCDWNTSYAKYYQDQLASHAEFEHKRYLEKASSCLEAPTDRDCVL